MRHASGIELPIDLPKAWMFDLDGPAPGEGGATRCGAGGGVLGAPERPGAPPAPTGREMLPAPFVAPYPAPPIETGRAWQRGAHRLRTKHSHCSNGEPLAQKLGFTGKWQDLLSGRHLPVWLVCVHCASCTVSEHAVWQYLLGSVTGTQLRDVRSSKVFFAGPASQTFH